MLPPRLRRYRRQSWRRCRRMASLLTRCAAHHSLKELTPKHRSGNQRPKSEPSIPSEGSHVGSSTLRHRRIVTLAAEDTIDLENEILFHGLLEKPLPYRHRRRNLFSRYSPLSLVSVYITELGFPGSSSLLSLAFFVHTPLSVWISYAIK